MHIVSKYAITLVADILIQQTAQDGIDLGILQPNF